MIKHHMMEYSRWREVNPGGLSLNVIPCQLTRLHCWTWQIAMLEERQRLCVRRSRALQKVIEIGVVA